MSTSIEECRIPKETGQPTIKTCKHCEAQDCPERVNEISYEENLVNRYASQDEMLFGFFNKITL